MHSFNSSKNNMPAVIQPTAGSQEFYISEADKSEGALRLAKFKLATTFAMLGAGCALSGSAMFSEGDNASWLMAAAASCAFGALAFRNGEISVFNDVQRIISEQEYQLYLSDEAEPDPIYIVPPVGHFDSEY